MTEEIKKPKTITQMKLDQLQEEAKKKDEAKKKALLWN